MTALDVIAVPRDELARLAGDLEFAKQAVVLDDAPIAVEVLDELLEALRARLSGSQGTSEGTP